MNAERAGRRYSRILGLWQMGNIIGNIFLTTHGLSDSSEYKIWQLMKERSFNKNNPGYKNYGARGIIMCKRWLKFENFYADMGPRPSLKHSIDRINNDKSYSRSNCRWATLKQQANNKRNSRKITFNGETKTLAQWSESTGLLITTIFNRIKRNNWSIKRALTEPAWEGKNGSSVWTNDK